MTLYECAKDGLPPLSERRLVAEWQRWPLFFGTVVYSFESICIVSLVAAVASKSVESEAHRCVTPGPLWRVQVMPLRNEMRNPGDFSRPLGVMNVGSVFIGVLLVALGSLGYLKFGDGVMGSLTLNLEQTSM